jgi:hypothetical protein
MNESKLPLVFYALDDVSGTRNLGSLGGEDRYSAQWINGSGHFDCPSIASNLQRPNLMRLVPTDCPWLHIVHNISLTISNGYTVMIWFKKRDPTTPQMPMVDGMLDSSNSAFTYNMWIYPSAQTLNLDARGGAIRPADPLYAMEWNNVAMRVSAASVSGNLNGTQVSTSSMSTSGLMFGDRINIGRREVMGDRVKWLCVGLLSRPLYVVQQNPLRC